MTKPTRIAAALLTVLAVMAGTAACDDKPKSTAQRTGQALTEQAFGQQQAAVPYPAKQLRDSLERKNIRERLLRTNRADALGYVYLMSFGKIIGYYAVRGKVTSNQSQMTTDTLVERHADNGGGNITYPAPGDDGSYGANEPGIFFFTTENVMVTTNLDYVWSDNPLPIDVPRLNAGAKR